MQKPDHQTLHNELTHIPAGLRTVRLTSRMCVGVHGFELFGWVVSSRVSFELVSDYQIVSLMCYTGLYKIIAFLGITVA
jgi:hypothetical protein